MASKLVSKQWIHFDFAPFLPPPLLLLEKKIVKWMLATVSS